MKVLPYKEVSTEHLIKQHEKGKKTVQFTAGAVTV